MKKGRLLIALVALLLVLCVALAGAGVYFVRYALLRPGYSAEEAYPAAAMQDGEDGRWRVLESHDGLRLAARVYPAPQPGSKWAVLLHGYKSDSGGCGGMAAHYNARGFHVLAPDLRAHGRSEGKYIGMGWLDRLDVRRWIDLIIEEDPQAQIVVHGVSMGGATAMMLAGEELPENVRGFASDCGYTSVWDIFADQLHAIFSLPEFPLMHAASAVSKLTAGYSFAEASCVRQLEKAERPVLFIHGAQDDFVRTEMVYDVYEACAAPKELLVVEWAGHAASAQTSPKVYYDAVFSFIEDSCIPD
ncbi:MAG: alpha/beta hydrolase [Eubacteriales bacterium]|nr:alpha/beta hydrolase [Eubacteriales bacterium]